MFEKQSVQGHMGVLVACACDVKLPDTSRFLNTYVINTLKVAWGLIPPIPFPPKMRGFLFEQARCGAPNKNMYVL